MIVISPANRLATAIAVLSIVCVSLAVERASAQLTNIVARKRQGQAPQGLRSTRKRGASGDATDVDYLFGRQTSIMARRNLRKEDTQRISYYESSMSLTYDVDGGKEPREKTDNEDSSVS